MGNVPYSDEMSAKGAGSTALMRLFARTADQHTVENQLEHYHYTLPLKTTAVPWIIQVEIWGDRSKLE